MKRKDFIIVMDGAIENVRKANEFSCIALGRKYSLITFGWYIGWYSGDYLAYLIVKDYSEMFRQNNSICWLSADTEKEYRQERIGMLQLFKQVALDSKLYERY